MSSNILHKASGADIHYISAVLQYLFTGMNIPQKFSIGNVNIS